MVGYQSEDALKSCVVKITAQTIYTTLGSESEDELVFGANAVLDSKIGNGVFVSDRLILCAAETVVLPPGYLTTNNRYPYVSQTQPLPDGTYPLQVQVASKILGEVSFYEVIAPHKYNPKCIKQFSYRLSVVMVWPQSNLALLTLAKEEINNWLLPSPIDSEYAIGNPVIVGSPLNNDDCHNETKCPTNKCPVEQCSCTIYKGFIKYLRLSKYQPTIGAHVKIVGTTVSSNRSMGESEDVMVHKSSVLEPYYTDPTGWILTTLSLFQNSDSFSLNVGAAVIDQDCRLLSIITTTPTGAVVREVLDSDYDALTPDGGRLFPQSTQPQGPSDIGEGKVGGISIPQLKIFMKKWNKRDTACSSLQEINDVANGTYYNVINGYLGLGYRTFVGSDYTSTTDFDGTIGGTPGNRYPDFVGGNLDIGPPLKQVFGLFVYALAGASNDAFFIPGQANQGVAPYPATVQNSNFVGSIKQGDRLNSINVHQNNVLSTHSGEDGRFVSLFNVMSLTQPGDKITIEYSTPTPSGSKYTNINTVTQNAIVVPNFVNFPYSSYPRFKHEINGATFFPNVEWIPSL